MIDFTTRELVAIERAVESAERSTDHNLRWANEHPDNRLVMKDDAYKNLVIDRATYRNVLDKLRRFRVVETEG